MRDQLLADFVIPYPPSGNHTVKHAGGAHYLTAAAKAYRYQVGQYVLLARANRLFAGPLDVTFEVTPPDKRARDSDNVEKTVKDALTKAGVWRDDSNRIIKRSTFEWLEPASVGQVRIVIKHKE